MKKPQQENKLKLIPAPTFPGDVNISGHGEAEPRVLKMEFKHMGKKAAREWIAEMKGSQRPAAETLLEIVTSFKDESGVAIPASVEAFDELMDNYPRPFADIVTAWSDYLTGTREKN
ncbi:phage tail assembly chaperone [Nitrosovibrio sp. Nv6]|uniref:phage tail assembly chaperone n=1 Tax=Nitrosovibrio sp. Nv6 TaxID=1855340 RepID=UPI0008B3A9B6|nr:phage tail assembly chaperone [Nitrosovibrio sp. Nv6]SEO64284.1 Phage tail assembly chaperone [Nitrosovibrio sp. Nv6]